MGIGPNWSPLNNDPRNPDPKIFTLGRYHAHNGNLAVEINYPNCTNYEGKKILIFLCTRIEDLRFKKEIDPHFLENSDSSPFARFEPTENGWKEACNMIKQNL